VRFESRTSYVPELARNESNAVTRSAALGRPLVNGVRGAVPGMNIML
jgi:hypothetical protein